MEQFMIFRLFIIVSVITTNLIAGLKNDKSYECLKRYKKHNLKFVTGDVNSLLFKCSDDGCPFFSGYYDPVTENISLPMKNDG